MYNVTFGKWHDGSDFTMNDVLYELALAYRRADPTGDVHAKDADAATSTSILFTSLLKGFTVDAANNSITMYFDYWHPDPSTVASIGNVAFPITPWTAGELALSTVMTGAEPCRVSEVTAATEGKEALDLTKGPCLTAMDGNIGGYVAANHRPPALNAWITAGEATTRWAALQNFRTTYGHYFASNGPYILTTVNAAARQSIMRRDTNYPFAANTYDSLTPIVPQVVWGLAPTVIIGQAATFGFNVRLASGTPYDNFAATWFVVNPATGEILYQGLPDRIGTGAYQVNLTATQTKTLTPGSFDLRLVVIGGEAAVPILVKESFIAIPDVDSLLAELRGEITSTRQTLENTLNNQNQATLGLQSQVAGLQLLVGVATVVAIISLIVGFLAMRRMMSSGKGPKTEPEEIPPEGS